MGYDLHITRRENWFDTAGPDIALDEWYDLIEVDPELRFTGVAEAELPGGETLRYESQGLAQWVVHPDGEFVWFDLRDGNIVVKNPDEPTIAKMQEIAHRLAARVQGDEGEFYDAPNLVSTPSPSARQPWWKRLFGSG